jgi:hypothetical protein
MAHETAPNKSWLAAYVARLSPGAMIRVLDSLSLPAKFNCGADGQPGYHTAGLSSEVCVCECHND